MKRGYELPDSGLEGKKEFNMAKNNEKSSKSKNFLASCWKELKKRLGVFLICLGVVSCAYWVMFDHYRTFRFDTRNDFVYKMESKLLDFKLKLRGPLKTSGKVGILAIDEKSLEKFGRWPFPRRYYEKAFQNLKKFGVKIVGFDSVYSEAERTYLDDALPVIENLKSSQGNISAKSVMSSVSNMEALLRQSPSDISFQRAIANFENIVMGYFFFGSEWEAATNMGKSPRYRLLDEMSSSQVQFDMPKNHKLSDYTLLKKAHGIVPNTLEYTKVGKHFAFFSNDADDDAINRWIILVANINGNLMPSLSLKTVAEYMNREVFVFFDDLGIENISLVNREDESDAIEVPIDPLGSGRMAINHIGSGRSFHHYSLADAYDNSFKPEEIKKLKGSLLLLGATATGINDIRPNPFDPSIDGVENHAAAIENIITGKFLKRPVSIYKTELLIILAIGLLFAPIMMWAKAAVSALSVFLFLGGYYYVDKYLWFQNGTWAFMAIPTIEILAMFILTTLYKYMTEEAEKKKVKGAFQHYLSPDVINQMLDDPEAMSLGGVKKELTVFFSDVRGFTTISESLSPEKLCELMNDYFTPMTSIVLKSGGVLDKYIGDAIMAFWGAPITLPNAPDIAAKASIDMLFALDRVKDDFKKKGFPPIDIGIGLNTGPMSVGNMGSHERFTYTVMGDAVNLGSRLEGLTKSYGIKIMMSEFTHQKLTPGLFFTRDLDDIRVKGKNEPVNVFELMRPDFLKRTDMINEFIEQFNTGRSHYKQQQWQKAAELFNQCLKMKPEDKATALYIERINEYLQSPPGEAWDGVYTFTHK
jgi:adenylate cyclase